ncbi:MAG: N-6 DNA methylase [Meiothermus sp.]|nr:N-6 DNA methylase [Meiothermus sp.]
MPQRAPSPSPDPLASWLALNFTAPERRYNPEVRDFLAELLGYPKDRVVTEEHQGEGFPDILLLTEKGDPWVVGDFKKDNSLLLNPAKAGGLWAEKRKYVTGFTRYVLFLTPHYLQVRNPLGEVLLQLNLPRETTATLRERLAFLAWGNALHEAQWKQMVEGKLPYSYLLLDPEGTRKLQEDLTVSFTELSRAAERALKGLEARYREYQERRAEMSGPLQITLPETRNRLLARLEGEYPEALKALFEKHLPRFADQYGREVEGQEGRDNPRIREAFAADSAAALMARVLFLRFLEDLGLTRRRLTNGGPERWRDFVEFLVDRATALVQVASMDLAESYREPFEEETFAWVLETNGEMDLSLQRLILRVNAYNFADLSEEVLGDIYQSFLPPDKRKRLGEFYTPREVVDLVLRETALAHHGDYPRVLDPACGSGSFLVRYLHHQVADAKSRSVSVDPNKLTETVWGFDLNPFAAYISMFQLMWGLLRLDKKCKPQVHVYNLNALLDDRDIAPYVNLSEGEKARDEGEWDYVVGNPPYIRAERAKYRDTMTNLYREVWGQNADTGLLFLWRAMKGAGNGTERPWVKPGGKLGMVVSGGYASSEAAARVWRLLWLGGGWSLRKLVWLEFPEENGRQKTIWDAARIPMVLILERTPPKPEDEIELWVPSAWPRKAPQPCEVARIAYGDFFDPKVNPRSSALNHGDYLLPLLREGDPPLLRKLYPGGGNCVPLTEAMETQHTRHRKPQRYWWTYGVQRGGVEVTEDPQGDRPVPVLAGRGLAVAWPGEIAGYVDLTAVAQRPYGKLSLWGNEKWPKSYLVAGEIALSPTCGLIRSKKEPIAALNTLVVGVPKEGLGEAVAAYLNSSLARWYWAVRLRSGVIQGYYAHIYPRTLEGLPWPRAPRKDLLEKLGDLYRALENLAQKSRDNPVDRLVDTLKVRKEARDGYTLAARGFGLDFREWQYIPSPEEVHRAGSVLTAGLFARLDLKDSELAAFVHLLLGVLEAEKVTSEDLQRLFIPHDYRNILQEYEAQLRVFSGVQGEFLNTLEAVDQAVFDLFGLTLEEQAHVKNRLANFPLNRLRSRYPWEVGEPRPLKAYTEDRFQ